MLDRHAISVGCLLVWVGMSLGTGLLIASSVTHWSILAHFGLAAMGLAAMHSIKRTMQVRETLLREAFNTGRAHERGLLQQVTPIH